MVTCKYLHVIWCPCHPTVHCGWDAEQSRVCPLKQKVALSKNVYAPSFIIWWTPLLSPVPFFDIEKKKLPQKLLYMCSCICCQNYEQWLGHIGLSLCVCSPPTWRSSFCTTSHILHTPLAAETSGINACLLFRSSLNASSSAWITKIVHAKRQWCLL